MASRCELGGSRKSVEVSWFSVLLIFEREIGRLRLRAPPCPPSIKLQHEQLLHSIKSWVVNGSRSNSLLYGLLTYEKLIIHEFSAVLPAPAGLA